MTDRTDVKNRAVQILRQLAAVEVERAQLARDLGAGGAGTFEDELARLWRALAAVVDGGLDGLEAIRMAAVSDKTDPWCEKPSALTFLGNLSTDQEAGRACLICGAIIGDLYPGETIQAQPSVVVNSKQMFIHHNPDKCTRELERKIDKEIPF